ncbi:uncharacterized protein Bfra_003236 [Botrytis fragariae]|uniref:Protein kinase domain-containing protein n=1 Tax=Botrytis fragariae TaxID=1964551 RepID=A0A8H6EJQ8_9HELO|nr:uncharacterized protein Bfra_003236 [Botrytis fragariae]KAF5874787.1 hypothetical protein Bfra_003236 [Botrytis fragariae]
MKASERAICKVRLPVYEENCKELDPSRQSNLRLKWAHSIHKLFFTDEKASDRNNVRNFDFQLNVDGSVENRFQNQPASLMTTMQYPTRYQLPEAISDRLNTTEERVARAELFALGSILYEVILGHQLFHEVDEGLDNGREIQRLIAIGSFPEDLWNLPITPKILGCLCPGFIQEMLSLRKKVGIGSYIKNHPYRFGFQVLGGAVTIASVVAVPVLGAVGFSAAGPIAGSTAAAWQSSMGLVEAGSIFAWCQSAAMGGAAVGGIIGAGVGGAGILAGASSLGALDGADFDNPELKKRFLIAWNHEMRAE